MTQRTADAARGLGWRTIQIVEDTLADLPGLEFKGKSWQSIQTAINRAKKEGIEFGR